MHAARARKKAEREAAAAAPETVEIDHDASQAEADALVAARRPQRTPTHEGRAGPRGRASAIGRSGETLSRKRTQAGDIFEIPAELIPKGWEYQWCAISITGNQEILLDQNLMFAENGWRPVPAERYPGRFMPVGHKGNIVRGGQLLMERPKVLSDEARAEDVKAAKQQITDRNESLKLAGMKDKLGQGIEMGGKYRGTGGGFKMEIDRSMEIEPKSYTIADSGE